MMKFALASRSSIKIDAVNEALTSLKEKGLIDKFSVDPMEIIDPNQCPQPMDDGGKRACENRVSFLLKNVPLIWHYDYIIAIENYICTSSKSDKICLIIHSVSENFDDKFQEITGVMLPDIELFQKLLEPEFYHVDGATKTYGSLYHEAHPDVPADNWMLSTNGIDRKQAIKKAIMSFLIKNISIIKSFRFMSQLNSYFRKYEGFPKPGINFLDWSDIFLDHNLVNEMIEYIADVYDNIKYVIGLESRGYFIAIPLALRLKAGFVPMKKPGKTPGPVLSRSYTKEYGTDTFELRSDLTPGAVLIVDDVLATGGSLEAAILLAKEAGHEVLDAICIRDVPALRVEARKRLTNYPIRVLIAEKD